MALSAGTIQGKGSGAMKIGAGGLSVGAVTNTSAGGAATSAVPSVRKTAAGGAVASPTSGGQGGGGKGKG